MLGASVAELNFSAHRSEQVALGDDVANLRNALENDGVFVGVLRQQEGPSGATDAN
jgi:hypothetical protein